MIFILAFSLVAKEEKEKKIRVLSFSHPLLCEDGKKPQLW